MKFASSYEPGEFEADIYAAWEAAGAFSPKKVQWEPASSAKPHTAALRASEEHNSHAKQAKSPAHEAQTQAATQAGEAAQTSSASLQPNPAAYSIVMPPPNANGNLHIGHGLTVALEDALTRYHRLRGNSTWYVPGADHAGFETWVVYERVLEAQGQTRFNYTRDQLYAQVWDFVQEQRGNMELQLRALGASCSWGDLTFTLDENVIRRTYATFEKMWQDGMIYRGEKLVNYCPKHQTAFADIEVVHQDEPGHLWDIAYPVVDGDANADGANSTSLEAGTDGADGADFAAGADPTEIIVSTTRPETLFGDAAVAVNGADPRYQSLIGKAVQLPLTGRTIPVIADDHADMEYGTGAVKITPAHDFDDFEVGQRHDLPRIRVISDDGHMLENAGPDYAGLTTEQCRKQVLKDLKAAGLLRGERKITHAVAHCYKCGTVIEPTLKEQWFVDTERLAARAIEHLEAGEIEFFPANKRQVLIDYLKGLKDWNISRQIPWGIAIPMFRRADAVVTSVGAGTAGADMANGAFADSTLGATASNGTFKASASVGATAAEPSTAPGGADAPEWVFDTRTHLTEIEIGGIKYIRDEDTFDTWFSSSHWPIVCTNWEPGTPNPYYPLNVMETGVDLLFAWVARMVMMGIYVTGEVPFRQVYMHGMVLDAHGKKMSKSKGNVINPMDMINQYGSDAFRLGILRGRSAGMNQAFSENSVVAGRNLCNKLWNISRFVQEIVDDSLAGSMADSAQAAAGGSSVDSTTDSPASTPVKYQTLNMGEDWICRELDDCRHSLERMMREYRFAEAVELLYTTIWDKYADWFIESQKIFRNVPLLQRTLEMVLVMLHPFAPFVTEAIWQSLSWTNGMIINAAWPGKLKYDAISAEEFGRLQTVITEVRATMQAIPGHKRWPLFYGDDSLVDDNSLLVQKLSGVPSISSTMGTPRGIRLALANHEVYLDVPEKVVREYATALEERILAVGRELDALNLRMTNPNYVERAPAALVDETRRAIEEKSALIERLKQERQAIV